MTSIGIFKGFIKGVVIIYAIVAFIYINIPLAGCIYYISRNFLATLSIL